MTGAECLDKINVLQKLVDKYEQDIQRYRTLAENSSSGDIVAMPTSATQSREALFTKYLDIIGEIEKRKAKIEEELEEVKEKAKRIMEQIQDLDCRMIMILRYIKRNTITEISKMLYISEPTCWRKFKEAKKEFYRLYSYQT